MDTWKENLVKTQRRWPSTSQGERPQKAPTCRHLDLGLVASILWENNFLLFKAVVPNLFGTRDWFHIREFFYRPGWQEGMLSEWFKHITFILHFISIITLWYIGSSQVSLVVKNLLANAGDTRDAVLIPGLGRSPEGGNDNAPQYSGLDNPMYKRAWWTTVNEAAERWTQQSNWTCYLTVYMMK